MCCSLECIHNMFHLLNKIYLQIPTCNPSREPFPRFWSLFFSSFFKSPSCYLTGTTVDDSEILQRSWHANSPICFAEISSGEPPIFWNINSVMNFWKFPKMPKTKRIWEDSGGFIRWLHRTLEYDDHVKPVKVDGWSRCYVWETSAKEYT